MLRPERSLPHRPPTRIIIIIIQNEDISDGNYGVVHMAWNGCIIRNPSEAGNQLIFI